MNLRLQELAKNINALAEKSKIKLQVTWIPREENVYADFLSKLQDWDDWGICHELFKKLNERCGPFMIDLFANSLNTKLPRFYSKMWVPNTSGVDAFGFSWRNESAWAVPPLHLVPQFLEHFAKFGKQAVLVVPRWPSQYFWSLLTEGSRYAQYIHAHLDLDDASRYIIRGTQSRFRLDNRNYPLTV